MVVTTQKYLIKTIFFKILFPLLSWTGIVGEVEELSDHTNYYLWTHKKFDIGYNGDRIVDVNLTSENKVYIYIHML